MPFGIDVDKLQKVFNEDFAALSQRLDRLIELEEQVLDELRKQGESQ